VVPPKRFPTRPIGAFPLKKFREDPSIPGSAFYIFYSHGHGELLRAGHAEPTYRAEHIPIDKRHNTEVKVIIRNFTKLCFAAGKYGSGDGLASIGWLPRLIVRGRSGRSEPRVVQVVLLKRRILEQTSVLVA
jgi:hypothetical protein